MNFSSKKIILITIVVVIVIGLIVAYLFVAKKSRPTNYEAGEGYDQVINNSLDETKLTPLQIALSSSTTIKNEGSNSYEINADSLGEKGYVIEYNQDSKSFIITLIKTPLQFYRLKAQEELKNTFNINNDELCSLKIEVQTLASIDYNLFQKGNLGISFCPGAQQL